MMWCVKPHLQSALPVKLFSGVRKDPNVIPCLSVFGDEVQEQSGENNRNSTPDDVTGGYLVKAALPDMFRKVAFHDTVSDHRVVLDEGQTNLWNYEGDPQSPVRGQF